MGAADDSHLRAGLGELLNVPHRSLSSLGQGPRAEQQLFLEEQHSRLSCSATEKTLAHLPPVLVVTAPTALAPWAHHYISPLTAAAQVHSF